MPKWVKGNQCFMASTTAWNFPQSTSFQFLPVTLVDDSAADTNIIMWQPGVLRALNIYVGENSTAGDINVEFHHSTFSGSVSFSLDVVSLYTILSGETGYFCFDESNISESSRTWGARDKIQIKLDRINSNANTVSKMTFGTCLEIKEEYLLDNDYPPNR